MEEVDEAVDVEVEEVKEVEEVESYRRYSQSQPKSQLDILRIIFPTTYYLNFKNDSNQSLLYKTSRTNFFMLINV